MAELDRTRIVEAALAVAARDGPDGLTMRALADELGVTATALYRHVADKKALISLMVDAVVTEQVLPAPTGDWREDLWRMAAAMREMTVRHPAVNELRRGHQIWTTAVLPLTERWMSLWVQSGLPLEVALRAGVVSSLAIVGTVEQELQLDRMQRPAESSLTWVPNARVAFGTDRDRDADFELVARALIDGVHRRLSGLDEERFTA
jgi:AcrR family transcriptional regulator